MPEASLEFSDNDLCRRYFAKFERIIGHLHDIAWGDAPAVPPGELGVLETKVIESYLARLANSFSALSIKYLLTGLVHNKLPAKLAIDQSDSGFPVFGEILRLAEDRARAEETLIDLPPGDRLRAEMVDHILKYKTMPRDLQFAMSQRVYYEMLRERPLFLHQNAPAFLAIPASEEGHARFLVHWAVYDTDRNTPNLYLMVLEDSQYPPVDRDEIFREQVEKHLIAQSLSGLKLLTIATGFDKDFQRLHPKELKRIHVGPLYSNRFTRHADAIQEILREAEGEAGQDWVFCWTVETLFSKESRRTPSGLFGDTLEQIYHVDMLSPEVFEAGASAIERAMILPHRPYQCLMEKDFDHLNAVRKYVVGPDGMILNHA
jgi:hypothetical protein